MTTATRAEQTRSPAIEAHDLRPTVPGRSGRPPRWLVKTLSPLALVVVWQILSWLGVLRSDTLASPVAVARTAAALSVSGQLPDAVLTSLGRVLTGLLIGAVAGISLATFAGLLRLGEDLVDAPIQMLRTIPVIGLIPLLIIWLGIGEQPKIVLISLAVAFPLYMNIFAGIRNADAGLVEAARTLGLGWFGQVRHVILPSALPNALVGLRYALGSAWLALVFGETINANSGIGFLMNNAREFFQTDVIVVCLVVYAVLGLLGDLVVRSLERGLLSWRPAFRGA